MATGRGDGSFLATTNSTNRHEYPRHEFPAAFVQFVLFVVNKNGGGKSTKLEIPKLEGMTKHEASRSRRLILRGGCST